MRREPTDMTVAFYHTKYITFKIVSVFSRISKVCAVSITFSPHLYQPPTPHSAEPHSLACCYSFDLSSSAMWWTMINPDLNSLSLVLCLTYQQDTGIRTPTLALLSTECFRFGRVHCISNDVPYYELSIKYFLSNVPYCELLIKYFLSRVRFC